MSVDDTAAEGDAQEGAATVDPRLLEILVCPLTKGPLRYDRARQELVSEKARLAYPIRDGIPIMLVDEARALGDDENPSQAPSAPPAP
jgi:uncharacterized protein